MGIPTDYSPGDAKNCPNLTVKGKKISGSAQANKSGIVLQHGTLLLDVDLPKMFTLLRVPWANSCMQVVNVAKGKITSVKNELGHSVTPETAANAIAHGFAVALNIQVVENVQSVEGELTPEEQELAQKLYKEKYSTKEWNFDGKSSWLRFFLVSIVHLVQYPQLLYPWLLVAAGLHRRFSSLWLYVLLLVS